MQSIDDLLRKNLDAFGERDAEKRRLDISTIWESDGVFVDPDGLHIGPDAIDNAIEHLLLKFPDFVFSELSQPDFHNGIGRLAWGFGPTGEHNWCTKKGFRYPRRSLSSYGSGCK